MNNIDLTYEVLNKKSDQEIESFFYFFFHGIIPQFENIPTEFEKFKSSDLEFYTLISKA